MWSATKRWHKRSRNSRVQRYANIDPRLVLGVGRTATREEIKHAFREKIRTAHPDAGGSSEQFQQLHWAYKAALEEPALPVGPEGDFSECWGSVPSEQSMREAWSIQDFYKWRRQQVQEEYSKWEEDANWHVQRERDRPRWPGNEQRRRETETRRRAAKEGHLDEDTEFRQALQQLQDEGTNPQAWSGGARHRNRDLNKWDWAELEMATPHRGERTSKPSPASAARSARAQAELDADGDIVVSYRVMSVANGSVKVPVYQSANGERYYCSPRTLKRVQLPQ